MKKQKHIKSNNTDLLESDDELPDCFEDIPFTPAYQDDCRFKPIHFAWLDQHTECFSEQKGASVTDQDSRESSPVLESDSEHVYESSDSYSEINRAPRRKLISKGVLSKRDIFFIKSIKNHATDTTLLWFIDFLMHKSMEPRKIGCLAENILDNYQINTNEPLNNLGSYKLIIKAWS